MRLDLMPTTFDGKLIKVVEEAGEFLQAYGKYVRFGPRPTDLMTDIKYDNIADMHRELQDLQFAVAFAIGAFARMEKKAMRDGEDVIDALKRISTKEKITYDDFYEIIQEAITTIEHLRSVAGVVSQGKSLADIKKELG
jgi:NTP pyrophosphatase (non-canonical NTP hydrolase)